MRSIFSLYALALSLHLAFGSSALAFPEMVRDHYSNCTSCHVSPSGGGVLTQYGREISRELLSSWSYEGEQRFAYFVQTPDWLNLGGDERWVQTYVNTPAMDSGQLIRMQTDVEGSVTAGRFTFVQSMGYEAKTSYTGVQGQGGEFISRRQYLMYKPGLTAGDELSFRVGKYLYQYGIMQPNHTYDVKRDLNMDEGSETINLEGAWLGDVWNFYLTGIFGRPNSAFLPVQTGITATASAVLSEKYKVGLSALYGHHDADGPNTRRLLVGPWGILGFTPRFYLLTELDLKDTMHDSVGGVPSTAQWGAVEHARLAYEIVQGLHIYGMQEYSRVNFSQYASLDTTYGAGLQFFPRPHFDFNLEWDFMKQPAVFDTYTDFAYAMMHFYL